MAFANGNLWKTPGPWFGLATGLAAPVIALALAGAIPLGWVIVLLIPPAGFAVQMLRTWKGGSEPRVTGSPALSRYLKRMMLSSFGYVVGLMLAIFIHGQLAEGSPVLWLVALLPTVPALGMIWSMFRYIVEEQDEYLRHQASLASLIGLGMVLCVGTVWGFLETFALVPNIFAWWVVPAWAIGLAIGQFVLRTPENSAVEES